MTFLFLLCLCQRALSWIECLNIYLRALVITIVWCMFFVFLCFVVYLLRWWYNNWVGSILHKTVFKFSGYFSTRILTSLILGYLFVHSNSTKNVQISWATLTQTIRKIWNLLRVVGIFLSIYEYVSIWNVCLASMSAHKNYVYYMQSMHFPLGVLTISCRDGCLQLRIVIYKSK